MFALYLTSAPRVLLFVLATLLLHLVALFWFGQFWLRPASAHTPAGRNTVSIALQNRATPTVAAATGSAMAQPIAQAAPRPAPRKPRTPRAPSSEPAPVEITAPDPASGTQAIAAVPASATGSDTPAPPPTAPDATNTANPANTTHSTANPVTPAAASNGASAVAGAAPSAPGGIPAAANPSGYRVKPLPSVEIQYAVQKTDGAGETPDPNSPRTRGRGAIRWQNLGQQYQLTGEFKFLFFTFFRFQSEGELDDSGIAPVLYSEKRGTRSPTNTHFQRNGNIISFSASTRQYPRSPGAQDWASVVWQLAGIGLADSEKFQAQSELEIVVAGAREAAPWRFQVQGLEHLILEHMELDAWHLARVPRVGSHERRLDIWLSPQHRFAPARILQTDPNGSQIEMKMTAFTLLTPTEP